MTRPTYPRRNAITNYPVLVLERAKADAALEASGQLRGLMNVQVATDYYHEHQYGPSLFETLIDFGWSNFLS